MKINDPELENLLNCENLKISVMSSIVGKYVYFELPCEDGVASEELQNEKGETMYFRTEEEALKLLEEKK